MTHATDKERELQPPPYDLEKMTAFLCGEASISGLWYGDKHPTERGAFWWRKHLRKAVEMRGDGHRELQSSLAVAVEALECVHNHVKGSGFYYANRVEDALSTLSAHTKPTQEK